VIGYRELREGLARLGVERACPVIAHASLAAFGRVQGGAEAVVRALLAAFETLVMPAFTYKTMLVPEVGPLNNGIAYGSHGDRNRMAEFFHPDMPADRTMGLVAEALRRQPQACRSLHPILSFSGVNAGRFLESQTITEPLEPVRGLMEAGGWVLLLGVDHTVNTSLHFAERRAGRKQFLRWALTPHGVVECRRFSGCSDGFEQIAPFLSGIARRARIGNALVQAVPLIDVITIARNCIQVDPLALLCERPDCERCEAVRSEVNASWQCRETTAVEWMNSSGIEMSC